MTHLSALGVAPAKASIGTDPARLHAPSAVPGGEAVRQSGRSMQPRRARPETIGLVARLFKLGAGPKADRGEVEGAAKLLFTPGDIVEVRILHTHRYTVAGYYDDHAAMVDHICDADKRYLPTAIYWVLNKIDPVLLEISPNCLHAYALRLTGDRHIVSRRWLPIDLDPIRPAHSSSSDEQHEAAIERARVIARDMPRSWGGPIIGDSGNGAHLLYRIDLPNDAQALACVENLLAELDLRYSDDVVKVDKTSANAARIWKVYGSVARKGDSTAASPHRISRVLDRGDQ